MFFLSRFFCTAFRIRCCGPGCDRAVGLFEEMLDMAIEPDVYTYSSVVNAYAKLGDVEAALRVLSEMAKRGVKPNAFTCAAVMQVFYFLSHASVLFVLGDRSTASPLPRTRVSFFRIHIQCTRVTCVKDLGSSYFTDWFSQPSRRV